MKFVVMNEIKNNEWYNWKLSYSNYLNVMNVYIKFMKFNILLIKFHEKYIKFHKFSWKIYQILCICIQIYFLVINTLNLM